MGLLILEFAIPRSLLLGWTPFDALWLYLQYLFIITHSARDDLVSSKFVLLSLHKPSAS